ncbi:AvrE-family type 3 secretion system effector [Pokkaliibacter sp. MBI-7]|uniref:AvrE-family type 3 secretion system effector n=1 Tax=Pokkaliibacter sp. MBI-7 TaxID=3040600 RepID=UPI002448BF42|nr:AvrE-family type 3 secretion system effector [Pokkaliibacter sp. MBI-7]MDH2435663.1 AvrE-family type 3 secretion system effector [Pokkaliibacter sp. MBI-7]
MEIQGTTSRSVSDSLSVHSDTSASSIRQIASPVLSRQSSTTSLAATGGTLPLPENLHQTQHSPDGTSPAKHNKRRFSLKSLLPGKSKHPTRSSSSNRHGISGTKDNTTASPGTEQPSTSHRTPGKGLLNRLSCGLIPSSSKTSPTERHTIALHSEDHEQPTAAERAQVQKNWMDTRQRILNGTMDAPPLKSNSLQALFAADPNDNNGGATASHSDEATKHTSPVNTEHGSSHSTTEESGHHDLEQVFNHILQNADSSEPPSSPLPPPLHADSATEPPQAATQPIDLSLDQHGKLVINEQTPTHLRPLLQETLGAKAQHYLAHHQTEAQDSHQLLDHLGRLFHLESTPTGYLALHSSRPLLDAPSQHSRATSGDKSKVTLSPGASSESLAISLPAGNPRLPAAAPQLVHLPDSSYRAQLTGVHSDEQGNLLRLQDGKLFQHEPALSIWQRSSDAAHSQLAGAADGKLYAIKDGNTLLNLTDQTNSEPLALPLRSYAVNQQGQLALLSHHDDLNRLELRSKVDDTQSQVLTIKTTGGDDQHGQQVEGLAVGLHGRQVFIADSHGQLFNARVPQAGETELHMHCLPQPLLTAAFGHGAHIEGFMTDAQGSLTALVKDRFKQLHACPLDNDGKTFKPGWNLSDSLVIDNRLGLDPLLPAENDVVDLGRLGQHALREGTLLYKDNSTATWKAAESNIDSLQQGLDGQAYVLHEGKVKKLNISQSSATVSHNHDNVFALPHLRNKPTLGAELAGTGKDQQLTAMAVINSNQYVCADRDGQLAFHNLVPGTQRQLHPPQTIHTEGLTGQPKQLLLDKNLTLFALTDEGLFRLPEQAWKPAIANRQQQSWQPLPDGQTLQQLRLSPQYGVQARTAEGSWQQLTDAGEFTAPATPAVSGSLQATYERLRKADKGKKIGNTGATARFEAHAGGVTNLESRISSRFLDKLRAHLFKPTLETPRPIKAMAYAVQHQWQGREGLKPLYEMEHALFKQLEAGNTQRASAGGRQLVTGNGDTPPQPQDLRSRLATLQLGSAGQPLLAALDHFTTELEHSAEKQLITLGRRQGVLDQHGNVNESYRPSHTKAIKQSLNLNRSSHNLSEELHTAWQAAAPSADSRTARLLDAFVRLKVDMSHQKTDIPLGRQRDINDRTALSKARLALDTLTLQELHQLVDKLELLSGHPHNPDQLQTLEKDLSQLRDRQYAHNPVKQFTDMGFINHKALENSYDAIKTFLNGFKKEDHGLNMTAKTVFSAGSQEQLTAHLSNALLELEPGELLTFVRGYGGAAGSAYVPALPEKISIPLVPNGSMGVSHGFNMICLRTDQGITFSIENEHGKKGTVGLGTGYDFMPKLSGHKNPDVFKTDIGHDRKLSPDLRLGGSVSGSVQHTQLNAVNFTLGEHQIPDFVARLTSGELTPLQLLQMGTEHSTREGSRWTASGDANLALELRAGFDLTEAGSNPGAIFRVSIAVPALSVNLASATRERQTTRNEHSENQWTSDNRMRLLNTANANINMGIAAGIVLDQKDERGNTVGTLPIFGSASASVGLTVDSVTLKQTEVTIKQAEPVNSTTVKDVFDSLEKHFKDSSTQQLLRAAKGLATLETQLEALQPLLQRSAAVNDDQYAALRQLHKASMELAASDKHGLVLGGANYMAFHTNLGRIDHDSLLDNLLAHLKPGDQPSTARQIHEFMARDPALHDMLTSLQHNANGLATIAIELTDAAREKAEQALVGGTLHGEDIARLLMDPANRRIASIEVSEIVAKKEGITPPSVIVGGTSNAAVVLQKQLGKVNFKYGSDQSSPRGYTIEGDVVRHRNNLTTALHGLKAEGLEMRS